MAESSQQLDEQVENNSKETVNINVSGKPTVIRQTITGSDAAQPTVIRIGGRTSNVSNNTTSNRSFGNVNQKEKQGGGLFEIAILGAILFSVYYVGKRLN